MSDAEEVKIVDKSNDHKYFVLVPRIVLALVEDTFELALWTTIKDIAGDGGTCIVGVRDLATLSMMSTGKAHQMIHALMSKQLLFGNLVKDPGYHSAVWHITVPDLWRRNTEWSIANRSLLERVKAKEHQHERSCGERSVERSCGERERSPGERERSCGDTKEELKEELKENKDTDLWTSIINSFYDQISPGNTTEVNFFNEYIKPTWMVSISDHILTVGSPDERSRDMLEGRATATLRSYATGFLMYRPEIKFVVGEDQNEERANV